MSVRILRVSRVSYDCPSLPFFFNLPPLHNHSSSLVTSPHLIIIQSSPHQEEAFAQRMHALQAHSDAVGLFSATVRLRDGAEQTEVDACAAALGAGLKAACDALGVRSGSFLLFLCIFVVL